MAQRKRRTRRIDPDVLRDIEQWTGEGWSGPRIMDKLADRAPSLRTIQDVMRDVLPNVPDESGWWASEGADPDDAALVLPVIGELMQRRVASRISVDLAQAIVRLRTIAPGMPLYDAYRMATRYLMAATTGASTQYLDLYMALELWRSPLMERGALAEDLIPTNWWYVGRSAPKEDSDV